MNFDQLGLSADILRAVAEAGYTTPTPIQAGAIPVILEGKDVLAGAQTGTGKTAGFTLPLLQMLDAEAKATQAHRIRALVLTPTRELAAQVGEAVQEYGKYLDLRSAVIFGGVKINPQIAALKQGVDILIATPGRLLDHVGQGTLDLSEVEVLVLDEADRMLDMGFIHDIRKVLDLLPEKRQNLLFSATFSNEIRDLADRLLDSPVPIEVAPRNTAAEMIAQRVLRVDRKRKAALLAFLVGSNDWRQVLVFTRTKHGANRLAQQLEKDGLTAAAIHGNKSQGARTRALAAFKAGDVRVLVATDIAARGLDIEELPHVVNFELPNVAEDYVHRIGRTGRAGCEGEALSLVCVDEDKLLADIQSLIGREIPAEVVEGFEPDPSIKAEPVQRGRERQGQRQSRPQNAQRKQASREEGGKSRGRGRNNRGKEAARSSKPASGNVAAPKPAPLDENGDVNGNTLFTDNGNRDAVMLAGGNEIARRKRGGGGNRKKAGTAGDRNQGNKGNRQQASAGKPGQKRGKSKRRRSGNAGRQSPPSLLGG